MVTQDFIQIILFVALITGLAPVLGNYMFKVFSGERHLMTPVLGWLEKFTYKFTGLASEEESNWKSYTISCLLYTSPSPRD